ncbi:MAG: hypothetical protein ACFE75_06870 [Candidatus Hodarchaeota archaeon]
MAITEVKHNINISTAKIQFICPICKSKKLLEIPKSVIKEAKQLTTMSIARGLVCEHQFQAFVDKNYQVRGYQRVDYEIENTLNEEKSSDLSNTIEDDNELFENLILEGNYLEYAPKETKLNNIKSLKNKEPPSRENKMSLKEIYNEFWEFIDEDNERFRDLINKDIRRTKTPLLY